VPHTNIGGGVMVGMLQVLTYMLAFHLVIKGLEILQIGLASNRAKTGDVIKVGVLALTACVVAAIGFVVMQESQAAKIDSLDLPSRPSQSSYSYSRSVPDNTPTSEELSRREELRRQEAITAI